MFLPKNQELINNYTLLTINTNFIVTVLTFRNESNVNCKKIYHENKRKKFRQNKNCARQA